MCISILHTKLKTLQSYDQDVLVKVINHCDGGGSIRYLFRIGKRTSTQH